jgi:hypothetical protein
MLGHLPCLLVALTALGVSRLEAAPDATGLIQGVAAQLAAIHTFQGEYRISLSGRGTEGSAVITSEFVRVYFSRPDRVAAQFNNVWLFSCNGTSFVGQIYSDPSGTEYYVRQSVTGNLPTLINAPWPAGREIFPSIVALLHPDPAAFLTTTTLAAAKEVVDDQLGDYPCWRSRTTLNEEGVSTTNVTWWDKSTGLARRWTVEYHARSDDTAEVFTAVIDLATFMINQPIDPAVFDVVPGTNDIIGDSAEEVMRAAARARGDSEPTESCFGRPEPRMADPASPAFDTNSFAGIWGPFDHQSPPWHDSATALHIAPATYVSLAHTTAWVSDAETGATLACIPLTGAGLPLEDIQRMAYLRHGTNSVLAVLSTYEILDEEQNRRVERTRLTALDTTGRQRWVVAPVHHMRNVRTMDALPFPTGRDGLYLEDYFTLILYDAMGQCLLVHEKSPGSWLHVEPDPNAERLFFSSFFRSFVRFAWPRLPPSSGPEERP